MPNLKKSFISITAILLYFTDLHAPLDDSGEKEFIEQGQWSWGINSIAAFQFDDIKKQELEEPTDESIKIRSECTKEKINTNLKICRSSALRKFSKKVTDKCAVKKTSINKKSSSDVKTEKLTLSFNVNVQRRPYDRCVTGANATLEANYMECEANSAITISNCTNQNFDLNTK